MLHRCFLHIDDHQKLALFGVSNARLHFTPRYKTISSKRFRKLTLNEMIRNVDLEALFDCERDLFFDAAQCVARRHILTRLRDVVV